MVLVYRCLLVVGVGVPLVVVVGVGVPLVVAAAALVPRRSWFARVICIRTLCGLSCRS